MVSWVGGIADKLSHCLRRYWQPEQVEVKAANQRSRFRRGRRRQPILGQALLNEGIDGMLGQAIRRQVNLGEGLQRPPTFRGDTSRG